MDATSFRNVKRKKHEKLEIPFSIHVAFSEVDAHMKLGRVYLLFESLFFYISVFLSLLWNQTHFDS